MSLKKQYSKTDSGCKVTFRLPKEITKTTNNIFVAGEFNNWNPLNTPMKKLKNGEYTVSINLEKGKEYQFKYVFGESEWVNEPEADRYVENIFHTENSVVIV